MLAVIKTGGKQYLVSPGDKIKIEKIGKPASLPDEAPSGAKAGAKASASAKATADRTAGKEGQEIIFGDVLLLEKNKKLEIGMPKVKGAKVRAKILKQGKAKKVIVLKYKAKKRYKVKKGHRQPFTEVEIGKIELGIKN